MDTIIDFFNHYNKTLAAEINALPEDNITVILSCDFFVNSLDENVLMESIYSLIVSIFLILLTKSA